MMLEAKTIANSCHGQLQKTVTGAGNGERGMGNGKRNEI